MDGQRVEKAMTTKGKLMGEEAGTDCYEKMRSMQLAPTSAIHTQAKGRNRQADQGFYTSLILQDSLPFAESGPSEGHRVRP